MHPIPAPIAVDPIPIDDATDPRVADYVGLKDAELRRRREEPAGDAPGLFIAEGVLVLRRLLRSSYRVRSVLLTPQRYGALAADLAGITAPVYLASQEVMNAVAGREGRLDLLHAGDGVGDRRDRSRW